MLYSLLSIFALPALQSARPSIQIPGYSPGQAPKTPPKGVDLGTHFTGFKDPVLAAEMGKKLGLPAFSTLDPGYTAPSATGSTDESISPSGDSSTASGITGMSGSTDSGLGSQ